MLVAKALPCKKGLIEMREVHLIAKLADLQQTDYQNTLILHALIELLTEKGLLTRQELSEKAHELDDSLNLRIQTIARLADTLTDAPTDSTAPA
jgi:hypothetical protein